MEHFSIPLCGDVYPKRALKACLRVVILAVPSKGGAFGSGLRVEGLGI